MESPLVAPRATTARPTKAARETDPGADLTIRPESDLKTQSARVATPTFETRGSGCLVHTMNKEIKTVNSSNRWNI